MQEIGIITLDPEAEEVLQQWLEEKKVKGKSEKDQLLWRIRIEIRAAYPGAGPITRTEALNFINMDHGMVFESVSFLEITQLNKTNLIPPIMITLPAGTFIMGTTDEKAKLLAIGIKPFKDEIPHEVKLSCSFELASTLVTQESFLSLMGFNPSYFRGDKRPVEQVNWFEAVEYCLRLSYVFSDLEPEQKTMPEAWAETARDGRNSENYALAMVEYAKYAQENKGLFSLPTEAQWEYAAKGGRNYFFGTPDGNISSDSAVLNTGGTREVASKKPNPFGFYDMSGNVFEWCSDWHGSVTADKSVDPNGPDSGHNRAMRGGSWFCRDFARTSYRADAGPFSRHCDIGFRPAKSNLSH